MPWAALKGWNAFLTMFSLYHRGKMLKQRPKRIISAVSCSALARCRRPKTRSGRSKTGCRRSIRSPSECEVGAGVPFNVFYVTFIRIRGVRIPWRAIVQRGIRETICVFHSHVGVGTLCSGVVIGFNLWVVISNKSQVDALLKCTIK